MISPLKIEDLIGTSYGRFTILEEGIRYIEPNGKSQRVMICECLCGTIKSVKLKELRRGGIKSCGCLALEQKVDVVKNNVYNDWTVLLEVSPYVTKDGKSRKVLARCICGLEKELPLNSLRTGGSKSCGCTADRTWSKDKKVSQESKIKPFNLQRVNNKTIGHWTILEEISAKRNEKLEIVRTVKAQCKCGYIKETNLGNIYTSKQCFKCSKEEIKSKISKEERTLKKRLQSVYSSIKSRCNNPNSKSYKNYGARGIKVDISFDSFSKFFKWMIDSGYTFDCKLEIDRKNGDGNYSVDNCRLVSKEENLLNMKLINLTLEDVHFIRSEDFDFETMKGNYTCDENVIKRIINYETFKTI